MKLYAQSMPTITLLCSRCTANDESHSFKNVEKVEGVDF